MLKKIAHAFSRRIRKPFINHQLGKIVRSNYQGQITDLLHIREKTLDYIESMRFPESPVGRYSYSNSRKIPLLYSSIYAALTRHLYDDLKALSTSTKKEWCNYVNSYQSDDGLYRDPRINCKTAETCTWWGWSHMTLHVIMGLSTLKGLVSKEFGFLKPFLNPDYLISWLDSRNWENEPANVSNEVQNIGTFLQYARDFQHVQKANNALDCLFEWLDEHQNTENGSWGNFSNTPSGLSNCVQTGYHLWCLYFYDQRQIKHLERIVDKALATQNKYGGFGVPLNSSACEDIDSIDPLVRISFLTDYRKQDVAEALEKALKWIFININEDGSFVFRRMEPLAYGHDNMFSAVDEGAMFPTWFRTLSLAYLSKAGLRSYHGQSTFQFLDAPGHQFWK
jgi:prenyltransferase beta subunit